VSLRWHSRLQRIEQQLSAITAQPLVYEARCARNALATLWGIPPGRMPPGMPLAIWDTWAWISFGTLEDIAEDLAAWRALAQWGDMPSVQEAYDAYRRWYHAELQRTGGEEGRGDAD
jgi:hypothetical protein